MTATSRNTRWRENNKTLMADIDSSALRFVQTANNATSAVATQTGVADKYLYITDVSGSSDLAGARIIVRDGSTIIWQDRISSGGAFEKTFRSPLRASVGANVSVTVNGTAEANANVAGYIL